MIVYDSLYPEQISEETLTVIVSRNSNPPIFVESEIEKTIQDDHPVGTVITSLEANDADNDELIYSFDRDVDRDTKKAFFVDPKTGEVYLRISLEDTVQEKFVVSIEIVTHLY